MRRRPALLVGMLAGALLLAGCSADTGADAPEPPAQRLDAARAALDAAGRPRDAVEMTAAYLDRGVENLLARLGLSATLAQKQTLATLMHLCGAGAASDYARRGFALAPGQSCGSHDARGYVARVASMQRRFRALASA